MSGKRLAKEQITIVAIETCAGWKFRLSALVQANSSSPRVIALVDTMYFSQEFILFHFILFYSTVFPGRARLDTQSTSIDHRRIEVSLNE